jgi:hypothetical protein
MVKLDMGKAWSEGTALLSANFGLVATVVGLFYFLPTFAIAILFPDIANPAMPEPAPGSDPTAAFETMLAALQEQYARSWPFFLFTVIAQYIGALSVLALFTERRNPTVGEALGAGFRGAPTYFATQILLGLALGLVAVLLGAAAFFISPFLGAVVIFLLVILAAYASIKLILVPAIIAMEGELNPITVMRRSWSMTKRNSLLIFLFLVVLTLTIGLLALVVGLVFGLVFAAFGEPVASIGAGFVDAVVNAVIGAIFLAVLAGIYRQLSGGGSKDEVATFE